MINNILFWDNTKSNICINDFFEIHSPSVVFLVEDKNASLDYFFITKEYCQYYSINLDDRLQFKFYYKKDLIEPKQEEDKGIYYLTAKIKNRSESIVAAITDNKSTKSFDQFVLQVKEFVDNKYSMKQTYVGMFDTTSNRLSHVVSLYPIKNDNIRIHENIGYTLYKKGKFVDKIYISSNTLVREEFGTIFPCSLGKQKDNEVIRIPVALEFE